MPRLKAELQMGLMWREVMRMARLKGVLDAEREGKHRIDLRRMDKNSTNLLFEISVRHVRKSKGIIG